MREFAHVWPQGGLFAFSGVDGETSYAEPFVAAGTRDGIGWDLWLSPRVALKAYLGPHQLVSRNRPDDFCFCDCWRCSVHVEGCEGYVYGAFLDRSTLIIAFQFDSLPENVFPRIDAGVEGRVQGDATVIEGKGWWLAMCPQRPHREMQVGVAISYRSEADAVEQARSARAADVESAIAQRRQFFESVPVPDAVWGDLRHTYYKAASVHKVNIESAQQDIPTRWTTPARMPHRHMWLWDTAFHSLGLMYIRPDLAEDAIRALLAKQRDDGQIPLATGPGISLHQSQFTQSPIVAWAVWMQCDHSGNRDFMEEVYPKLVRYVEWFEAHRKNDNGLYGWTILDYDAPVTGARGGESGMDNSPRFDEIGWMTAVDLCAYMASEYLALERMAELLSKHADRDEWGSRRRRIADRVNQLLWDDEDRFYYDLDERGAFVPIKTCAGLLPLLGRIPDRDQAEALRLHVMDNHKFWSPFPVPSVSQDEECYTRDMWRGPTWPSMNMLVYYGLTAYGFFQAAHDLAHRTVSELMLWYTRTGCLYESYDSQGVVPPHELFRKGPPGKSGALHFGVVADRQCTAAAYVFFAHRII